MFSETSDLEREQGCCTRSNASEEAHTRMTSHSETKKEVVRFAGSVGGSSAPLTVRQAANV